MAYLTGMHTYTGSVGDASAYRMHGTEKIILRQKGGPSKSRIKHHPNFEMTRRNNEEWKACIMAAKNIALAVYPLKLLADYNYSGQLNGICKSIQLLDSQQEKGKRSVLLSQGQYMLEGFSFCKYNLFESVLRCPVSVNIDSHAGTALVEWPLLEPGINLYNPKQQPMYRLVTVLAAVADLEYDEERKLYNKTITDLPASKIIKSDWYTWKQRREAEAVELSLPNWANPQGCALIVGAGIEFGIPVNPTEVKTVKYASTARIIKMG